MSTHKTALLGVAVATVVGCAVPPSAPPTGPMSFFVSGTGLGKGGDLGKERSAMTGHHDKRGAVAYGWGISWNSAHPTLGCDPDSVRSTGGDALLYCFAA